MRHLRCSADADLAAMRSRTIAAIKAFDHAGRVPRCLTGVLFADAFCNGDASWLAVRSGTYQGRGHGLDQQLTHGPRIGLVSTK